MNASVQYTAQANHGIMAHQISQVAPPKTGSKTKLIASRAPLRERWERNMKLPHRRQFSAAGRWRCRAAAVSRFALAQAYPTRPITIIVPFAPGGPADTVARIVAERMRTTLGQPILIENVAGATGSIGVGRAARASADGYTLIAGTLTTQVLIGALYTLQYDLLNDFKPVVFAREWSIAYDSTANHGGEQFERTHGLAEGQPQQGVAGDGWRRRPRACRRHPPPATDRNAISAGALSRQRPGHAGFGGRAN